MDTIKISILEDGTIKTETDKISGPNHQTAEMFLRGVQEKLGGDVTITHKHGGHEHVHTHEDQHQH